MSGTDMEKRRQVRDPARTRRVLVQAMLDAISEGDISPTTRNLAERAGVSERSVFVHFSDLDELRKAATEHQEQLINSAMEPVPAHWTLHDRVDALLAQHERIYSLQVGIRLTAVAHARTSADADAKMRYMDDKVREHFAEVLETELAGTGDEQLLDLVEAMLGWPFRYHLIDRRGLTSQQASESIRRALLALLERPVW